MGRLQLGSFRARDRAERTLAWLPNRPGKTRTRTFARAFPASQIEPFIQICVEGDLGTTFRHERDDRGFRGPTVGASKVEHNHQAKHCRAVGERSVTGRTEQAGPQIYRRSSRSRRRLNSCRTSASETVVVCLFIFNLPSRFSLIRGRKLSSCRPKLSLIARLSRSPHRRQSMRHQQRSDWCPAREWSQSPANCQTC